jgi:hypothetical protein
MEILNYIFSQEPFVNYTDEKKQNIINALCSEKEISSIGDANETILNFVINRYNKYGKKNQIALYDKISLKNKLVILAGQSNAVGQCSLCNILNSTVKTWYGGKYIQLDCSNNRGSEYGVEAFLENCYHVKYASSGKSMYEYWKPSGLYYDDMVDRIKLAMNNLTNFDAIFVWIQGEADSQNETYYQEYEKNWSDLIISLDKDLPQKIDKIIDFKISENQTALPEQGVYAINEAKQNVASKNKKISLINTDIASVGSDNLHYNNDGIKYLGSIINKII